MLLAHLIEDSRGSGDFMQVLFQCKRTIRSLLRRFNIKIEKTNKFGQTFTDEQLIKSIHELISVYSEFVFHNRQYDDRQISLIKNLIGTGFGEALYIMDSLQRSLSLEGDVCEFGVAQGATSALLANEIKDTSKNLWLFDSFEGLPKPSDNDVLIDDIFNLGSMDAYRGTMACPADMVKARLSDIQFPRDRVKIIPGFIEQTITRPDLPRTVCFAYIDFDFYEPILIALKFLHHVLQPGGCIIVDDYNFFSEGVKIAVNEFCATHQGQYEIQFPVTSAGHFCILKKNS